MSLVNNIIQCILVFEPRLPDDKRQGLQGQAPPLKRKQKTPKSCAPAPQRLPQHPGHNSSSPTEGHTATQAPGEKFSRPLAYSKTGHQNRVSSATLPNTSPARSQAAGGGDVAVAQAQCRACRRAPTPNFQARMDPRH